MADAVVNAWVPKHHNKPQNMSAPWAFDAAHPSDAPIQQPLAPRHAKRVAGPAHALVGIGFCHSLPSNCVGLQMMKHSRGNCFVQYMGETGPCLEAWARASTSSYQFSCGTEAGGKNMMKTSNGSCWFPTVFERLFCVGPDKKLESRMILA